ncbi:MAG: hypothetical protein ND807_16805 [Vicinamibacterales bacterium]|nr:hypothetical protein [Vicinamibacterales bacterium]
MHNALVDEVATDVVPVDPVVPVVEGKDEEDEDDGEVGLWLLPHPTKPTATTDPMKESTSRRLNGNWLLLSMTPAEVQSAGHHDTPHIHSRSTSPTDAGTRAAVHSPGTFVTLSSQFYFRACAIPASTSGAITA